MGDNIFWSIIDSAVSANTAQSDYDYEKLWERLRQMTPEEILGFAGAMHRAVNDACTWKLWGAAYIINGGCSYDGFEYFRGWLIAQGSEVYRRALADPDSLADHLKSYKGSEPIEDQDLLAAAWTIFNEKTGSDEGYATGVDVNLTPEADDEKWDFEDDEEMKRRLPRLEARGVYLGGADLDDEGE